MARGAITPISRDVEGSDVTVVSSIAGSAGANYTTGGETVTATDLGVTRINSVDVENVDATAARLFAVDRTGLPNSFKLKVFTALSTEAASNSNQSTFAAQVEVRAY